jgi:uncharacterized membrane protein
MVSFVRFFGLGFWMTIFLSVSIIVILNVTMFFMLWLLLRRPKRKLPSNDTKKSETKSKMSSSTLQECEVDTL